MRHIDIETRVYLVYDFIVVTRYIAVVTHLYGDSLILSLHIHESPHECVHERYCCCDSFIWRLVDIESPYTRVSS